MHLKQSLIPVFRPNYGKEEIEAVNKVIKSGWVGLGPKTEEFEERFARYIGVPYAIAVNSATSALHLALLAAGIKKGDEVIVPALTFVSTAHAVLYVGATPVFVDIEPDTLCISADDTARKITKKTRAIIPVHYGGHPCDMDKLKKIADSYNLTIIEDAAHACGSSYRGKKIGSISQFTCFSFHAVKNLATGDGGMITVKNQKIARKLRQLRWLGINRNTWDRIGKIRKSKKSSYKAYDWYYEVGELGYKYHMNDITAALGLVQLSKLDEANQKRHLLTNRYNNKLNKLSEIKCPVIKPNIISSHHNYVIRCKKRDDLHTFFREKSISSSVHYMPLHLQPYYKKVCPKTSLPIVENEWKQLLTLPLYPQLTFKQQDYIIDCINEFYLQNNKDLT